MKKYLFIALILLFFVISNVVSFSQGYFLGKIDSDFLFASNRALLASERLEQLRNADAEAVQLIIFQDEEDLSRMISYYGNYLEHGPNHSNQFFFLDFPQLYMHKDQYEEWLEQAIKYRIENPLRRQDGTPVNPYRSELEYYQSLEDELFEEELIYLKNDADSYDRAVEYVKRQTGE